MMGVGHFWQAHDLAIDPQNGDLWIGDREEYRIVVCSAPSWQISMPPSASRSSAFRSESGCFTYIMTTGRIASGELSK